MRCPQCDKLAIGEMQNFCRYCMYTFNSGGDRWFTLEDEEVPFRELE